MNRLHNMSAPPRSRVRVAPGFVGASTMLLSCDGWLPPEGDAFAQALLRVLGQPPADDAGAALRALVDGWLAEHAAPRALLLLPARDAPLVEPLAAVALLSRAAGNCFLRERAPRLDHATLSRRAAVPLPLPWSSP